jgi:hypothetical protein
MFTLAAISYGQSAAKPEAKPAARGSAALQTTLTATEKGLWAAWKNNDIVTFKAILTDDVVGVSESGVSGKAEVLSRLSSKSCALTDYSLEDFKLTMVDKDTALLTFKGSYACGGQNRRSGFFSTIFTNRRGKWMNVFCQETSKPS